MAGCLQNYPKEFRRLIYKIRQENSGWGAITILVELEVEYGYSKQYLPSPDTIHRYLQEKNLIPAKEPRSVLPSTAIPKVEAAHDLWEMDAQGAEKVEGLGYIAMINIKDVKSKAYIYSFPVLVKTSKSQPKTIHYLWALRLGFEEFGLPKAIQVDKDSVFIDNTSKSSFPSVVHLFLIGLGINFIFIDQPPPYKQSMVERSHQTLERQALRGKSYQNWQKLFTNVNKRRTRLNYYYPSRVLDRQAPLEAMPTAKHSGCKYSIDKEDQVFQIKSVETYLAQCKWYRRVSKVKTISLHSKVYYLKCAKAQTSIEIQFCPQNQELIFYNDKELVVQKLVVENFVKNLLQKPSIKELVQIKNSILNDLDFPL